MPLETFVVGSMAGAVAGDVWLPFVMGSEGMSTSKLWVKLAWYERFVRARQVRVQVRVKVESRLLTH
jgi:uncharacterized membrane protein